MKKLLIVSALLVTANIAPAHAISEGYRRQLEREHKTQVQDAGAPVVAKAAKLKPIHAKKDGIEFTRSRDGFAYINGKAAAVDEDNQYATVYSAGLITVSVYKKTGKINAMEDGKFLGAMK